MTIEELIDELDRLAEERCLSMYQILRRNAGWGVMWYDAARDNTPAGHRWSWDKQGLVTHQYRPTLREALEAEVVRLAGVPAIHRAQSVPDPCSETSGNERK